MHEITIDRLGINGEGVGRLNGLTVFVDGALPGERVSVELYEKKKTYAKGRIRSRLNHSPHRIKPPCPLFMRCGGCQIMHLNYEKQLEAKREKVVDAFERIGKIFDVEVAPCHPSPAQLSYRNKIQLPVKEGKLGLYQRNSHDIVEIEGCLIQSPLGEKVLKEIQRQLPADIKHVLIRTTLHTDEALVILVSSGKPTTEMRAFGEKWMALIPEIKGVIHNHNPESGNTILGSDYRTLCGQGSIEERLCGMRFTVSPASFFQVNPHQAEQLYFRALALAELKPDEILLDAFCGVGTLALIAASRVKRSIGIECVSEAIADAKENAKMNQVENAEFICGNAEEVIFTLDRVDVAILNPPRKGCEPKLLGRLADYGVNKLIYVSCDMATLARDLRILLDRGYEITTAEPFDMFPQTAHVECIVILKLIEKRLH